MLRRYYLRTLFMIFLCGMIFVGSGCTPLRRKFTRKKKQDGVGERKFVPILDPIDYPVKVYSSKAHYKKHYALWKVWNRDFLQTVDNHGSDKRQKYLLGQIIEELAGMRELLSGQLREDLSARIEDFRGLLTVYDKPVSMRNTFSIKKRIERNAKEIRRKFTVDIVFPNDQ